MPVVALAAAVLVVGFEQLLAWKFGPVGVVGFLVLAIGLKSKNVTVDDVLSFVRAPRGATGLAAFIAGQRRPHLREEWAAVLAGDPENGRELSVVVQLRLALGFLLAALRMRVHDLASPLWVPVDWLLSVESRSNTVIALLVGGQAVYIAGDGGLNALFSEIWEPCAICGGALYVFFRWLRKVRGIELAAARGEESTPE
ncbi:hypothetical protein [Streptomyces sp. E5N298]|uniref:hypothetical protein n=1 Tax=Streptomyces sp. E5N298 TaxID=1851983 RepID=UPI000EF564C8|nr:hypothetical protein [Streptomyces sp. E5N298]